MVKLAEVSWASKMAGVACSLLVLVVSPIAAAVNIFGKYDANAVKMRTLESQLKIADELEGFSGAKLIPDSAAEQRLNSSTPMGFSFCIRFNFKILGGREGRSRVITIADWRENADDTSGYELLWFGAEYPASFFGFGSPRSTGHYKSWLLRNLGYSSTSGKEDMVWRANEWNHMCFSYHAADSFVRVVRNGEVLNVNFSEHGLDRGVQIAPDILRKTYLGMCPYNFSSNYCSGPESQISDFNMWDEALTEKEMKDFTTCRTMLKGNLVNWDTARFELYNMTEESAPVDMVCNPIKPGDIIYPALRSFDHHNIVCKRLKSVPTLITSAEQMADLSSELMLHTKCARGDALFWSGWSDRQKEGQLSKFGTGETLSPSGFQPWYAGEPDGLDLENCIAAMGKKMTWADVDCDRKMCGYCDMPGLPHLSFRGMCAGSTYDTQFTMDGQLVGTRHAFRGYTDSQIFWNASAKIWHLELYHDKSVYALNTDWEFPLGTFNWTVYNEPCYDNQPTVVQLSLNACNSAEFNCNDGLCIPLDYRCNGQPDCLDRTDEQDCEIIRMGETYLSQVAPPEAEVVVDADILTVMELNENSQFVELQMELRTHWKDSRLSFVNLHIEENLNALTEDDKSRLWSPRLLFYNTEDKMTTISDDKAVGIIGKHGPYRIAGMDKLHNEHIFEGSENPVTMTRPYSPRFMCDFSMFAYPFSTRKCAVMLTMYGNSGKFVKLKMGELRYMGQTDLTEYFVKDVIMEYTTISGRNSSTAAIKVELIFGQRILSYMLKTFLPTVIICLASFTSSYYKPMFFEAIATVNLTSLLVLTTMFISTMEGLPQTYYVKMMDVWLIFVLFIPFVQVLLHTYLEMYRLEEDFDPDLHDEDDVGADYGRGWFSSIVDCFALLFQKLSETEDSHNNPVYMIGPGGHVLKRQVSPGPVRGHTIAPATPSIAPPKSKRIRDNSPARRQYRRYKITQSLLRIGLPLVFGCFVVVYFMIGAWFYYS